MAFSIFAAGTGGYSTRHRRRFTDEGDIYELADALGKVAERGNINLGGQSDAHRLATDALGTITTVHLLKSGIEDLMLFGRDPEIWLLVHSPGTLWGTWDEPWYRQAKFRLDGDSPGLVTRDFLRCMHRCRVSRWGVMLGVARIISEYESHIMGHAPSPTVLNMNIEV